MRIEELSPVDILLSCLLNMDNPISEDDRKILSGLKDEMLDEHPGIESKRSKAIRIILGGESDIIKISKMSELSVSELSELKIIGFQNFFFTKSIIDEIREDYYEREIARAYAKNDLDRLKFLIEESKSIIETIDPIAEYEEYEMQFNSVKTGETLGMSTGIEPLDQLTYGLLPGNVWICGAYYGYGKTFFAINVIESLLRQDKRVLFFSLEMSSAEIIQRLIGLIASTNTVDTLTKQSDEIEARKKSAKDFIFDKIRSGKLVIETHSRRVSEFLSKIISENSKEKLDMVVLDYIQLLASGINQYEAISEAMKNIQDVTKKTKVTTLLLSQVNNDAQIAGKNRRVDGLKGAGDIGATGNVIIMIERDKDDETGKFTDEFLLRVTKVRHNEAGNIKLKISFPGGRISEYPKTQSEELADYFKSMSL